MPTKPVKFLLVDDLESNLTALQGLLRRDGLELLKARSGSEALELLLVHDVALAILDVQMPLMDGFELAETMRGTERTRRIPIIFLTAGAMDQQRRFRGYEMGAVDFLFKPIEAHILQSKADVFFELARQRQELRDHALQLEQKVAERTADLRETNAQLEAFCYTVAHDLRSPLRAQQSYAHTLLNDYGDKLDKTGREYAERIISAAGRLDTLISDLLAFSRISRTEMKPETVDLQRVILDVSEELAFQIEQTQGKVQIEACHFFVRGHKVILRSAISNLFTNALKFTRPNTTPVIRISCEKRGKWVRLWVEDEGIGIAAEYHHQIFGVFHRLHKVGEYAGTGVGLAIVQKGVERMGGRVGVESQEGVGSRFWIELEEIE